LSLFCSRVLGEKPVQGVETQLLSFPQFKSWFRFEGDCDPGGFTSVTLTIKIRFRLKIMVQGWEGRKRRQIKMVFEIILLMLYSMTIVE